MSETESVLDVASLSWSVAQHQILDSLSFAIAKGEFVGLIGPNGAGKSSLMRCCYRACKPSSGSIRVLGQDIWAQALKRNAQLVAVILQEHTEQAGLLVRDVIEQGLTPHKKLFEWDTAQDRALIQKTVQELDLVSLFMSEYRYLSGGEKQRVMLARAIVQQPQLLIMDEPTNHLDVHYQIDLMNKVKARGFTVLASFHDLNLAAAYCDRLLVLHEGRLVANGTPNEVLSEDLLKSVFQSEALIDKNPLSNNLRVSYVY